MTAIKPVAETEDTITLSRADFESLLQAAEDAQDMAAVEAHREYEDRVGWETARRSYLTSQEARRLLEGENPVRVWRQKRGISQRALAEAAEIGASYLAEIESGKKPGSVDVLQRLAVILEVDLGSLAGESAKASAETPGPVSRSIQAATRLINLAEGGADSRQMEREVRAVVTELSKAARKAGLGNQVRAVLGGTLDSLRSTSEEALRRRHPAHVGLEAAIRALQEEYRRL
jgi:transcriptional regulator with XRE-family HTH domain